MAAQHEDLPHTLTIHHQPKTPTNQTIFPIDHRLAKSAPILDQSEDSCVTKRGTSILCGPDRSVSTEDNLTDNCQSEPTKRHLRGGSHSTRNLTIPHLPIHCPSNVDPMPIPSDSANRTASEHLPSAGAGQWGSNI